MANISMNKEEIVFKIRVGNRFFISSSDLFGDVFFDFENTFFPEKNWNDFILIILNSWIKEVIETDQKSIKFYYMDGSYEVHIDMLENQQCKMDFIEGGAGESNAVRMSLSIPLKDLVNELIRACNCLLEAIQDPKTVKNIEDVKDIAPNMLLHEIEASPRILRDYEKLKKSYDLLLKFKTLNFEKA